MFSDPVARFHLSRRLPWEQPLNRLTRALREREARGLLLLDLTASNPTRVGLAYPEDELADLLCQGARPIASPAHPLGLPEAREALAAALSRPGDPVAAEDLVLTASTSESYSLLFQLFADPGDEVLTTVPGYPLLDSLAALAGLSLTSVPRSPSRGFALDRERVELALTPQTRLLALVHPTNPTGTYLSSAEADALTALAAARGLPLLSDEVFFDFPHSPYLEEEKDRAGSLAGLAGDALVVSLGGLSKSAGLPGWKLGWMRLGGPEALRSRARAALELAADSYLSVAAPVQRALPGLLALAPRIRQEISQRIQGNLAALRTVLAGCEKIELLPPQGGWSAVLRVRRPDSDEDLALRLLDREGVLVHPGYFFDFATDDFLVLSLLPAPDDFAAGVRKLAGQLC